MLIYANVAHMNVSLTPKLDRWISNKVKEGKYQTASEVVREALRLLAEREERRKLELDRLRREIDIGLQAIRRRNVSALDMKQIKAEVRKELAAGKLRQVG